MSGKLSSQSLTFDNFEAFELNFLKNKDITNPQIINFWATWCKPCIAELPYFEQISRENDSISVVLVSLDFEKDIDTKLKPFLDKMNLRSNVVLLTDMKYNKWIDKVSPQWSGAIPATLFIKNEQRSFKEKEYHSAKEIMNDLNEINNL